MLIRGAGGEGGVHIDPPPLPLPPRIFVERLLDISIFGSNSVW